MLVQHKERDFLVSFGGIKKDPSDQVKRSVHIVTSNDAQVMHQWC